MHSRLSGVKPSWCKISFNVISSLHISNPADISRIQQTMEDQHLKTLKVLAREEKNQSPIMQYEYGVSTNVFNRINKWYITLTGYLLACDVFASFERHHLDHFMT